VVGHAHAGQTLVLTSTSYVGSTRQLLVEPLEERGLRVGEDVFVAFCPEHVEQGDADAQAQSRLVVGGVTETCFRHASALLCNLGQELLRVSSPETAEMVRLYESTFEAVNVALAFELADACRTQGVHPLEVADAAAARPSGPRTRSACAGVPAHRIASEPHHLLHPLRERGRPATLAEEALRRVDARPRRLAMRAYELLARSARPVRDARVLVVGASSEPVIAERREAPAIEIIERLRATGAQVDFHDPLVPMLLLDGDEVSSIDPDPRRDASGFGPEDYDLAIIVAIREGHDYGWLQRCPQVLDCTYRERTGRRYYLP
jgi:nucleotide sugar dehydrogenase